MQSLKLPEFPVFYFRILNNKFKQKNLPRILVKFAFVYLYYISISTNIWELTFLEYLKLIRQY